MALSKPQDQSAAKAVATLSQRLAALERSPIADGTLVEGIHVGFNPHTDGVDKPLVTTKHVAHGLGRRPRGYLVVNADRGVWSVTEADAGPTNSALHFTSGWQFLDYRYVATDSTSIEFSGLDGNLDYEYYLEGRWKPDDSAADNLFLGFNSANPSNHYSQVLRGESTTISGGRAASAIQIAHDFTTNNERHYIRVYAKAETGSRRYVHAYDVSNDITSTVASIQESVGVWNDGTTRCTSLFVYSNNAGAIEANSFFELYRRPRSATVSLWVF